MSDTEMAGKVALVTGGGIGLGRAISRQFAARGAKVVVADIDQQSGAETAAMLKGEGADALFVRADISVEADVRAMVEKTVAAYGRIDYAVNNAAIEGEVAPLVDLRVDLFDRVIAVNLRGVFLGLKYQIPVMVEQGSGAIVNVSSIAGVRAHACIAPYVASKHGVNGLTKTAAIEYGPHGLRVNSLCPGGIQTPQLDRYLDAAPALRTKIIEATPLRRLSSVEEMAGAALWLCSSEASFVNGHQLVVDGGRIVSDC